MSASAVASVSLSSSAAALPIPRKGFLRQWNVSKITFIAEGSYGVVYRAETAGGGVVAIKRSIVPQTSQALFDEATHLESLQRERITEGVPQLLDRFWYHHEMPKLDQGTAKQLAVLGFHKRIYVMVTPFAGERLEVIFTRKQDLSFFYDVTHVRHFAKQQLKIVGLLRQARMVHGDIKPANSAYIPDNCKLTLLDFGSLTRNDSLPPYPPTLWYRAPEYLFDFDKSQGDIWSVACIFYQLGSGGAPLFPTEREHNERELLGRICNEIGPPKITYATKSKRFYDFFTFRRGKGLELLYPSVCAPAIPLLDNTVTKWFKFSSNEARAFRDLILSMLKYTERPEPDELLKHPFFTQNYAASPPVKK